MTHSHFKELQPANDAVQQLRAHLTDNQVVGNFGSRRGCDSSPAHTVLCVAKNHPVSVHVAKNMNIAPNNKKISN